jgi:uncharacterized protein YdhG (YjbR/CyaY superfamily)
MARSEEVDAWFEEYDNPMKDVVLAVREVILEDERITETIKWKSPTFTYEGNMASFNPRSKKHASLMFHTGASIPGDHPRLTGGGETARYMTFADLDEVAVAADDLRAIVDAWCDSRG